MEQMLSEAIGLIYDCVAHEELWPRALRLIAEQVEGFLTTLAVFDTDANSVRLAQLACDDQDAIDTLMAYARDVPFYHLLHKMEIDDPVPLKRMFDLYGPDGERVWNDGELYRNFHSRFGVRDSINMAVFKRPNRVATINVSTKYSDISCDRFDIIALFGPHIRRAVTIHDMLEMERSERTILRDVVDRLECGVIIVSEAMEILYANSAAESHLREEVLFSAFGGKLGARCAPAQNALSRAVSLSLVDEVVLGGSGIDVPLGTTPAPAVAHVLPLARRQTQYQIETKAAAAVFIAAAGTVVQSAVEAVAALFALTAAEKRVAGYVSGGMTRYEIAQAQGVTEGTVKSQLAAIFDKTGTGDQRSLQSLMKELTPPVRRG